MTRSGADGTLTPLSVTEATPYAVTLRVPATVATGTHALWIHNGLGGPAAWRQAGMLPVVAPVAWKTERFNVRDFGPRPEEAILAAIAKAKENGGGGVYLPRGRYGLAKPLDIPDGVVLAGEAMELVSLFWPDFETPPLHLVRGNTFGLENLSLYCQNHRTVVLIEPKSDGAFVRNVRIRANCHFMIDIPGEPFRGRLGPKSNRDLGAGIAVHGRNFEIRERRMFGADREMMTLDAKGVGQYRIVTAHQGRDWEVDRAWTVLPDATSRISVVPYRGRNLFIGNDCEDGGPFQLYGSAHECIVAENRGRRMDAFLVWGLDPHDWGQQPSWYCQFLDNTVVEGNGYGHRTGGFGTAALGQPGDGKGRSVRDVVFRRNACLNNAGFSITGNLHGALVEHNTITHADIGIVVRAPASGVILRANALTDVATPLWGDGISTATVVQTPLGK
ncbi:hypothetical protein EBR56_03135 [bacterium]|nr:hypothetical protein [bacterium]